MRDLNDFVVPRAANHWYSLGLHLLYETDSRYEETLFAMKNCKKNADDLCLEVFNKWTSLTESNPSWNQLIEALKSPRIKQLALAKELQEMLQAVSSAQVTANY